MTDGIGLLSRLINHYIDDLIELFWKLNYLFRLDFFHEVIEVAHDIVFELLKLLKLSIYRV